MSAIDGRVIILIVTDSVALPTGMAETTRLIFETLLYKYPNQYELHQIGLFHCYAATVPKWPIFPTRTSKCGNGDIDFDQKDKYGQKTFPEIIDHLRPDIVFAFNDPDKVMHLCNPPEKRQHKLVLYINFDGYLSPSKCSLPLSHADLIFTNSHFAVEVCKLYISEIRSQKVNYMYSPADTKRFASISELEKAKLRQDLFPEWMAQSAFVLGWVGRNQWRKQVWLPYKVLHYLRNGKYLICQECGRISLIDWDPMRQCHLDQEKTVLESRPGYQYDFCIHCASPKVEAAKPMNDLFLWLHMPEDDPLGEWPLKWLEHQFDLRRGRDLYYTEGFGLKAALSPEDMPVLYQLWDALIYLSGGEGFGLPAWEAMCCGLPVVYTDYSSHAEFLNEANAGLPVDGILQPESQSCILRMIADVGQAIEAVRKFYFNRALGRTLGQNGRAFVQQYTPEIQAEKWHRIFQRLLGRTTE